MQDNNKKRKIRKPLIYPGENSAEIRDESKKPRKILHYENNVVEFENQNDSNRQQEEIAKRTPLIYENGRPEYINMQDDKVLYTKDARVENMLVNNDLGVNCKINNQLVQGQVVENTKDTIIEKLIKRLNVSKEKTNEEINQKKMHIYTSWLETLISQGRFINVSNTKLYYYYDLLGIFKLVEGNAGISLLKSIFFSMEENEITYEQYNRFIKDLLTDPRIGVNEKSFFNNNIYINLSNGVLNLSTMNLENRDIAKNYYMRTYLGCNFIVGYSSYEQAQQALSASMPHFSRYLATSLQNNPQRIRLLFEIIGYCLSNIKPFKKLLICQGANDSGKSVIMKFLTAILTEYSDKNVVASLSLSQLSKRFSNELIESAKLVCAGEIDSNVKSIDMSIIKKITGGDDIVVEKKFGDPKAITPQAKLLFNTNEPLCIKGESTAAMVKRIETLLFPVSIEEPYQDPYLLQHILGERDQILTISMWALKELLDRGEFTKDPDYLQLEDQYIGQVPQLVVDRFIQDKVVANEVFSITESELFFEYSNYCRKKGYVQMYGSSSQLIGILQKKLKCVKVDTPTVINGMKIRKDE